MDLLVAPACFFCERCETLSAIPMDPGVLVCFKPGCQHRRPIQFKDD